MKRQEIGRRRKKRRTARCLTPPIAPSITFSDPDPGLFYGSKQTKVAGQSRKLKDSKVLRVQDELAKTRLYFYREGKVNVVRIKEVLETTDAGTVCTTHAGNYAVVDRAGKTVYYVGDFEGLVANLVDSGLDMDNIVRVAQKAKTNISIREY